MGGAAAAAAMAGSAAGAADREIVGAACWTDTWVRAHETTASPPPATKQNLARYFAKAADKKGKPCMDMRQVSKNI
jgi:aminoglycoside/choline kinase family phosphotransferase